MKTIYSKYKKIMNYPNLPKSQIMFHKKSSTHDFIKRTLATVAIDGKKHFLMDDAFLKTMEASFLCCHVYIEDGLKRGPQVQYYILLLYRFLERLDQGY